MEISINAPSYKRPDGVDTLKYLPQTKIWVCETEAGAYIKANPGAEIVPVKKGIQGNLCRVRNHILDCEFEKGADVVLMVDDDLQYLGYHEGNQRIRMEPETVPFFLIKYSVMAKEVGAHLWGLNCNQDKQSYREYTPFSMLSYIGGPFQAHLPNPIRYDEKLFLKEDYDITLQHLNRYRRVLRLNKFFYIVKQGGSGTGQVGGQAVFRNVAKELVQIKLLQDKWGEKIIRVDDGKSRSHSTNKKVNFDVNPIMKCPIRGV